MTHKRQNNTGSLYKRSKGGAWVVKYYDHDGRRRTKTTKTTDRRAAERILSKLVSDAALRRDGVVDTAAERVSLEGKRPIGDHLDDWKATLTAKGNTERHVELVTGRARKVIEGCRFETWADVNASGVMAYLGELRRDKAKGDKVVRGVSAQTFNFYLAAVKQFAKWMKADRRAGDDALAGLKGLNVRTDRRHDRRALTADKLRRLINETRRQGVVRWNVDATERATLYWLASETGLRAGEARSLTPASFDLDANVPTVTVAAAYSKRRRDDVLPLRADLVQEFRRHLGDRPPDAPAFNVPPRQHVAEVFRADVEAAGLPYKDASDKVADFHSLRHTFITNLANGGVHPSIAQALARHSTITLTMDRYTHRHAGDETAAIDVLPDLKAEPAALPLAATGTTDRTGSDARSSEEPPPTGARKGANRRNAGKTKEAETPNAVFANRPEKQGDARSDASICNGEGGIRTHGSPKASPVFETGPFSRSGTSPNGNASRRPRWTATREVG